MPNKYKDSIKNNTLNMLIKLGDYLKKNIFFKNIIKIIFYYIRV